MTTAAEGEPSTLSVDAVWDGNYRCRVQTKRFEIFVDEPVSVGGDGTGPQPTELFLGSLAACFALSVAHVARKRHVELEDLVVGVTGVYDGPRFVKVRIEVRSSHDRSELDPIVERASALCYVSNTLRAVNDTEVVVLEPLG